MKIIAFDTCLELPENFVSGDIKELNFNDYSANSKKVRFECTYYENAGILDISKHRFNSPMFNGFTNMPFIKVYHTK